MQFSRTTVLSISGYGVKSQFLHHDLKPLIGSISTLLTSFPDGLKVHVDI